MAPTWSVVKRRASSASFRAHIRMIGVRAGYNTTMVDILQTFTRKIRPNQLLRPPRAREVAAQLQEMLKEEKAHQDRVARPPSRIVAGLGFGSHCASRNALLCGPAAAPRGQARSLGAPRLSTSCRRPWRSFLQSATLCDILAQSMAVPMLLCGFQGSRCGCRGCTRRRCGAPHVSKTAPSGRCERFVEQMRILPQTLSMHRAPEDMVECGVSGLKMSRSGWVTTVG